MSYITDIQKYSIHDGDGIRTTVFFKGCPLHCTWCHNPETQDYRPVLLMNSEQCAGCGACVQACPAGAISLKFMKCGADSEEAGAYKAVTDRSVCTACGTCTDFCVRNLREITGKEYQVDELMKELRKDEMFYEQSGGGVTLSGGEVMTADMDYVESLMKKLNRIGISVMIDTSGQAPYENFRRVLPYTDAFLYDIKTMDPRKHLEYMGTDNERILDNLRKLSRDGARLYIRIPTIREVNGDMESMRAIADFLVKEKIRAERIHLLPYHNTGSGKYERLDISYGGSGLHAPTDEEMSGFVKLFQEVGFQDVRIGG